MQTRNRYLNDAKSNRADEFYTRYEDIARELRHYDGLFKDKVVYCNCDDATRSNFYKYFVNNFASLGLKKVIAACWRKNEGALLAWMRGGEEAGFWYAYDGKGKREPGLDEVTRFAGDGDFRSRESVELLRDADIVVTNPPFSLFREYMEQLRRYDKKFLVIASINALTYREVFDLLRRNKIWLGVNFGRGIGGFIVPPEYGLYGTEAKVDADGNRIVANNGCLWLTNLDHRMRRDMLALTKCYYGNEASYPFYDNCRAINVDKTSDIPVDYQDVMGVPITFLHKYNPGQFEIVGFRKGENGKDLTVNGRSLYCRVLIKQKMKINQSRMI